jgi:hypothetical protein
MAHARFQTNQRGSDKLDEHDFIGCPFLHSGYTSK